MCGFFSIFSTSKIDDGLVKRARDASLTMQVRGPDDYSEYRNENYFSLFNRLAIRDLTIASRQPFMTSSGRYIFSFNGEIYSFKDKKTKSAKNTSDTIQLSELIDNFGVEAFDSLKGMFSICLYDQSNNSVFITRDPLGIKPLFYSKLKNNDTTTFVISSTKNAILKFRNSVLDDIQIYRFLKMGISSDTENTFYKDLKRLKPGSILEIDSKGNSNFRNLKDNVKNLDLKSNKNYSSKEHNKVLNKILDEHLIADIPVFSTISGGIDSSFISSYSSLSSRTRAFTLDSELFESEIEDLKFLFNNKNLDISIVNSKTKEIPLIIRKIIEITRAPFASSSWIFQYQLFENIKKRFDCKVILVGEGADEIYSGYKRMLYPFLFELEFKNKKIIDKKLITEFTNFMNTSEDIILANYEFFKNNLSKKTDYECQNFERIALKDSDFVGYERYMPARDKTENNSSYYKKMLLNYITRADIPSTLEILDSISMENSIELRVPFIDFELLSYILKIDTKYHFQDGFNKYMLRDAADILPTDLRWRPNKKQRPSASEKIMKDICYEDMVSLLRKDTKFFDSSKALKEFLIDMDGSKAQNSNFWFRIYTFMIFLESNNI
tara:strand:+ start:3585 stop:5411 length:1827 start_codon:yes stop_codon:yes gene_type:complete